MITSFWVGLMIGALFGALFGVLLMSAMNAASTKD
jgi:hypothetical protein